MDEQDGRDGQAAEADDRSRLERLIAERRAEVAALRAAGVEPYPVGVAAPDRLADVRAAWADRLEAGEESEARVGVGGRLVLRRGHGKLVFLVLREGDAELQAMAELGTLGEDGMAFVGALDVGDWVVVRGRVIRTRRGELSVRAEDVVLVAKALRPLPDKWHGVADPDVRYRQRYVDLVVNADARRTFAIRSRALGAIRAELHERGFVEVETPVLHPIPGGAAARPFTTHHEALDLELYLRIAVELYLKRLVVGGLTRVYEIARTFRNEGLSSRHNPEFTMLETYEAFADYEAVMALTQALVQRAADEAVGTRRLAYGGREVDVDGAWPRRPLLELVREATGRDDLSYGTRLDDVRALCRAHDVRVEERWGVGKLVLELYEHLVEHTLWAPTFVTDYPVEVSPLARQHRRDPDVVERFELIVVGRELANGYSELTDPDEQRRRFEAQAAAKVAGDVEAMGVDEDYLRAMEYGLPPTGGLGVGIDRLVMLLADVQTIRDVILFPTLRPEP